MFIYASTFVTSNVTDLFMASMTVSLNLIWEEIIKYVKYKGYILSQWCAFVRTNTGTLTMKTCIHDNDQSTYPNLKCKVSLIHNPVWWYIIIGYMSLSGCAWVILKPTVGRPNFLCWSADKPTGAVTLKTYLTDYLHQPHSFPFSRPSPDDRQTVGWLHFPVGQHATCRPIIGRPFWQLLVNRSYDILASMCMRPSANRHPIVGRRSPDTEPITKTQKSSGDQKKI